ncbi:S-layer homology domain-containing protein [Paenibacillus sp. HN-1]|uniref:S-layer homology domain-containing protein n=1 Tax=Paenibacillus TaxID=44249 RepID=UPI001CA82BC1|nr:MULTISPECIES: S-layer homology domain-containing protein [Paenibacillus]MBY9085655.1 S-layer homology domain-containing protein [Paenibacillus sinensis]
MNTKPRKSSMMLRAMLSLTLLLPILGQAGLTEKAAAAEYDPSTDIPMVRSSWAAAKYQTTMVTGITTYDNTSVIVDSAGDYVSTLSLSLQDTEELGLNHDELSGDAAAEITGLVVKTSDTDGVMKKVWANGLYAVSGSSSYTIDFQNVAELKGGGLVAVGEIFTRNSGDADRRPVILKDYSGGSWTVNVYSGTNGLSGIGDALIMQMDASGRVLGVATLGGSGTDILRSVKATADGGFVSAGTSDSQDGDFEGNSRGKSDGIVVKCTADGTREWLQNLGGSQEDRLNSIVELPDSGGYAVVGSSSSASLNTKPAASDVGPASLAAANATPETRGLIARLDIDGKQIWGKSYFPGSTTTVLNDVVISKDGTRLTIAGVRSSKYVSIAVQYDLATGGLISEKSYSRPEDRVFAGSSEQWQDTLSAVVAAPGGGYLFMGQALALSGDIDNEIASNPKGGEPLDFVIFRTDENLNMEWVGFYGGTGHEQVLSWGGGTNFLHTLAATPDGFVLAGYSVTAPGERMDGDLAQAGAASAGISQPFYSNTGQLVNGGTYSVVARFTFDWDNDGVINSRDLYPDDPDYSIPFGADANKLNLNAASAREFRAEGITHSDIEDLPPTVNVDVYTERANITMPVAALDRILGSRGRTVVMDSTYLDSPWNGLSALLPAGQQIEAAVDVSAKLDGAAIRDFGTEARVALSVNLPGDYSRLRVYSYNSDGSSSTALSRISTADFSGTSGVAFLTAKPGVYLITGPNADQLAADSVIAQIAALPSQVSIAQTELVTNARAAYEGLAPSQQSLVTNYPLLVNAEQQLADMADLREQLIAINPVIAKFSNLPDAGAVTLNDQAMIEEARAAYEALTDRQKELVQSGDNLAMYNRLLEAEAALQELQLERDTEIANVVVSAIAALPSLVSLADQNAVAAVRARYDALTPSQQALVTNYVKLQSAEAQINIQLTQNSALKSQVNDLTSSLVQVMNRNRELIASGGPAASTSGSASVTPALGGSISLGSGAAVEIPPGALNGSAKVKVGISEVASPPMAPFTLTAVSSTFEFTVGSGSSYTFAKPVTITLPFDSSKVAKGREAAIYYYDTSTSKWVRVGGTVNGNQITASVYHFTKFAVFAEISADVLGTGELAPLNDIEGHWANRYIQELRQRGTISGYPDGTFKPNKSISRAEFAALVVKSLSLAGTGTADFNDIGQHWAREMIRTAANYQIVNGYPDGRFMPDQPVSREEMVAMAVYAFQLTGGNELQFADNAEISDWAKSAVGAAVKAGIVSGQQGNKFAPKSAATRAEAVTLLAKAMRLR